MDRWPLSAAGLTAHWQPLPKQSSTLNSPFNARNGWSGSGTGSGTGSGSVGLSFGMVTILDMIELSISRNAFEVEKRWPGHGPARLISLLKKTLLGDEKRGNSVRRG